MNHKEQIINAFKKYQIEYHESDITSLRPDLIQDISHAIEEIESQINEKNFEDYDVLTLMGFKHSTYNGQVYNELWDVITGVANVEFNSSIAESLNLSKTHVELIQYLLCDKELADYGTSPRGCFLTAIGRSLYDLMVFYNQIEAANQIQEEN